MSTVTETILLLLVVASEICGDGRIRLHMTLLLSPFGPRNYNAECCDEQSAPRCLRICQNHFEVCNRGEISNGSCLQTYQTITYYPVLQPISTIRYFNATEAVFDFAFNNSAPQLLYAYVEIIDIGGDLVDDYLITLNANRTIQTNTVEGMRPILPTILSFEWQLLCDDDWYGDDCELYCIAQNTAFAHYTCNQTTGDKICNDGYEDPSTNCTRDLDECTSNPCQNGATCHDCVNHYACTCEVGYTGERCATKESIFYSCVTTEPPTTELVTTQAATTKSQTTNAPTTAATTNRSTTNQPTSDQPTTNQPTTDQPTTNQPRTKRSTTSVYTSATMQQPTGDSKVGGEKKTICKKGFSYTTLGVSVAIAAVLSPCIALVLQMCVKATRKTSIHPANTFQTITYYDFIIHPVSTLKVFNATEAVFDFAFNNSAPQLLYTYVEIIDIGGDLVDDYLLSLNANRTIQTNTVKGMRPIFPTILSFEWQLLCDDDWFGDDCGLYCIAQNTVFAHYTCNQTTGDKICNDGYEDPSTNCTRDLDECTSNPCQNGATCHDCVNHYACTCEVGYTGERCTTKESIFYSCVTTEPPTTELVTTQVATTKSQTTNAPTTAAATNRPTTNQPTTDQPTANQPTTNQPTTTKPTTNQPTTKRSTTSVYTAATMQQPTGDSKVGGEKKTICKKGFSYTTLGVSVAIAAVLSPCITLVLQMCVKATRKASIHPANVQI
ncbi:protein serrate-like [Corticium candelabrum]|uniref:protein serrate-like n=1 Tax=Corticium candelabrum TaxID=121492 RepID=UPI002E264FD3|nr:protein serrate-like [Corticium candelabrum]